MATCGSCRMWLLVKLYISFIVVYFNCSGIITKTDANVTSNKVTCFDVQLTGGASRRSPEMTRPRGGASTEKSKICSQLPQVQHEE